MAEAFRRRVCLPIVLLVVAATAAAAQQRLLTLDNIYDPDRRVNFNGNPVTGLTWVDLGTPERVVRTMATLGISPPWLDRAETDRAAALAVLS